MLNLRNKFYDELNKFAETHSVDELIDNPTYAAYINPTYTSGGSKEQMILRKMKNNALKNYPKEYDSAAQRDAVENMWEDNDDSLKEKSSVAKDVVAKVENKKITHIITENKSGREAYKGFSFVEI